MSYHIEYDAHKEPLGIRREADGYLIYIYNKDSKEWNEFEAWNKKQSIPLDYISSLANKIVKDNPDEALAEAKAEAEKQDNYLIKSLLKKIDDLESRIAKLEPVKEKVK